MSRKITGAAFLSLDGVIQAPGQPQEDTTGGFPFGGWMFPHFDEQLGAQVGALFDGPFDLLLGRRTYDIFAAYWPFMPPDDPIAAAFGRARKYVLTGSGKPLGWQESYRLGDIDAVAALRKTDGPDLVIQGSSTLYPQLLARGLLDRLQLLIAPVILGTGKRLFGDGTPGAALRLVEQRVTSAGLLMATYEPAGPVATGSFAAIEPSEQELARRHKIEQGVW